jgi:hypothetical protein
LTICAAVAWYLEPPAFLDRLIRSLAYRVDHVVCLDGAWRLFPDAAPRSTDAEHETLVTAAAETGQDITIRVPDEVFESQVAKRAELMALAAEHGDWVLVIDGDEYVSRGLGLGLHWALERTDAIIGDVKLKNTNNGETMPYSHPDGGLRGRLSRAGATVDIVHSGYFYEGRPLYAAEPAIDVADLITITHDNCNRGRDRNQMAIDYRRARQNTGVEVWA